MTHKLISIERAAEWLGVSVEAVAGYVSKGWLTPEAPGELSYFDASKVQRLKRRLSRNRGKRLLAWSLVGAVVGAAVALLARRPRD